MKRTILATILALACVASLDGAALAQRAKPHDAREPRGHAEQCCGDRDDGPGDWGGPRGGMRGGPPPMGGPGFGPGGPDGFGPPPPPPGFRPPSREELDKAGVTAAQRAKLEAIRGDAQRAAIRTRADLEVAELDLRDLMESEHADRAAVERAIDRLGGLRTELHKTQALAMLAARDVLTADQRAKLDQERRDLRPRRGGDGSH
jgi:Spy/CpxP family protein refolding chaperone